MPLEILVAGNHLQDMFVELAEAMGTSYMIVLSHLSNTTSIGEREDRHREKSDVSVLLCHDTEEDSKLHFSRRMLVLSLKPQRLVRPTLQSFPF